jgi:hypothetical protein
VSTLRAPDPPLFDEHVVLHPLAEEHVPVVESGLADLEIQRWFDDRGEDYNFEDAIVISRPDGVIRPSSTIGCSCDFPKATFPARLRTPTPGRQRSR